jgi:peroxiredoxin Q/BCP
MHTRIALLPLLLALFGLLPYPLIGMAATPVLGSPAPAFKLQDQGGKWHELQDYRGKWVVLYFYPKDQTPGCTTQACGFRDNIAGFREAGAVVLGISVDDVDSHRKFADKNSLTFPLLADPSKETVRKYGVLKSYIGGMQLAKRDTFVIDPEGRIAKRYADVDPKGHSQQVLNDIKELQKNKAAEQRVHRVDPHFAHMGHRCGLRSATQLGKRCVAHVCAVLRAPARAPAAELQPASLNSSAAVERHG